MASQLRRSGWALLHVALALAIALLTLPVFGSGASAEEVAPVEETTAQDTTTQDTTTGPEQTEPAPAAEAPAPAAEEPAPAAEAPAPEVATAVEDPAPEPEGVEIVGSPVEKTATAVKDSGGRVALAPSSLAGAAEGGAQCGDVKAFLQRTPEGAWVNGNVAGYAEGEFVPQRVDFKDLPTGLNTFVFNYEVKVSEKWAFDRVGNFEITAGDAQLVSWAVESPGGPVATVTVKFEVLSGSTATLEFGAHIASELDHGPGTGAGSIPGSNYHVRLVSVNCKGIGTMTNQIKASEIEAGELTVVKDAIPADGTDFRFGITPGGDASTFSLDDDGDGTLPDRVTYRVPPGSYTVAETDLPAGWNLTGVVCSKVPSGSTATSRTVSVADDEKVTCTFTNAKTVYKNLSVAKTATPSYDRDFDWTVDKSVVGLSSKKIADGQSATFDYLVEVTPSAPKDSGFEVSGTISVANPNTVPITGVTVGDSIPGATCTVSDGGTPVTGPVTIPAGGKQFAYTCAMGAGTDADTTGTNTVDLTWSANAYYGTTGAATATKAFDFADATQTVTDGFVTVSDDRYDLSKYPGGNIVQASGGAKTFTYSLTWPGEPGVCKTYDNTATITELDGGTQTDGARVEVCEGKDLVVTKTVVHSYYRTYDWSLSKAVVGHATKYVDGPAGATFDYEVTATAGSATDSKWAMSGTIKVSNANDWAVTLTDVTDSVDIGGGASCTVVKADLVVPANGSRTFPYTCTFASLPTYDGTNTATATWSGTDHVSPSTSASGTAAVEAKSWAETSIDKTVTIVDDKTDPAHPVSLGTATWTEEGATTVFTYTGPALAGRRGECLDYTNKAWIEELPAEKASAKVTVCWPAGITVAKDVDATYDTTYFWDVSKKADKEYAEVGPDGTARFDYTVVAEPKSATDSNWKMSGTITLTNPNTYKAVTVTLADSYDGGGTCTPDKATVELPKSGTVEVGYSCTFTSKPAYSGTNTVTASWDEQQVEATAPVAFRQVGREDFEVPVYDDQTDPEGTPKLLGRASWDDPLADRTFESSLDLGAAPGQCVDHTNTAWIDLSASDLVLVPPVKAEGVNPFAQETVAVCEETPLSVTKTAEASFDRAYEWDISKVADRSRLVTEEGKPGTVGYTVGVTPTGFVDSGWELSGEVSVTNPNRYKAVTVTLSDVPDLGEGVACVFAGDVNPVVAAGETRVFGYTCDFEGQPAYAGSNTVVVDWGTGSVEASAEVVFEVDEETDKVVSVTDDKVGDLGQVAWSESGETTEFEYDLELQGEVDACETVTNTATIVETGQSAQADVEVCGPAVSPTEEEGPPPVKPHHPAKPEPPIKPEAPVKARPPADLPETGAPSGAGALTMLGGLMMAVGALLLMRRRRDAS